jgi:hypothetical protein
MPDYRLYLINELGHIMSAGNFFAEEDTAAIRAVEQARGCFPMELWCGARKVHQWCARSVESVELSD